MLECVAFVTELEERMWKAIMQAFALPTGTGPKPVTQTFKQLDTARLGSFLRLPANGVKTFLERMVTASVIEVNRATSNGRATYGLAMNPDQIFVARVISHPTVVATVVEAEFIRLLQEGLYDERSETSFEQMARCNYPALDAKLMHRLCLGSLRCEVADSWDILVWDDDSERFLRSLVGFEAVTIVVGDPDKGVGWRSRHGPILQLAPAPESDDDASDLPSAVVGLDEISDDELDARLKARRALRGRHQEWIKRCDAMISQIEGTMKLRLERQVQAARAAEERARGLREELERQLDEVSSHPVIPPVVH